jgi:hypothetical protein
MAQAMALVFALVSVWGGLAHACHGSLHGTAQETAVHHAPDHGAADATHDDHAPAPSHKSHKSTHPCCADLQCHGGVAVVTASMVAFIPHAISESFAIADQTHEDSHLASLDRPPRPTVQA